MMFSASWLLDIFDFVNALQGLAIALSFTLKVSIFREWGMKLGCLTPSSEENEFETEGQDPKGDASEARSPEQTLNFDNKSFSDDLPAQVDENINNAANTKTGELPSQLD